MRHLQGHSNLAHAVLSIGFRIAALAGLWVATAPPAALAQTVVDPQIYVCQSCTSPSGGLLIGNEGNPITDPTGFNMGVESGNHTLMNPLLVIIGVPDWTTGAPGLTYFNGTIDVSESLAAVGTYGTTTNQTSFTSGDAYTNVGVTGSPSVSFTNLVTTSTLNGLGTPTSFEEFVYDIPISLTSLNSPITIDTDAPKGSFVIGYSCEHTVNGTSTTACATDGDIGRTPNTNVGFVTVTNGGNSGQGEVPEPGSLVLLGTALASVGMVLRRRRRSEDHGYEN